jgi:hypothetical protein
VGKSIQDDKFKIPGGCTANEGVYFHSLNLQFLNLESDSFTNSEVRCDPS